MGSSSEAETLMVVSRTKPHVSSRQPFKDPSAAIELKYTGQ
jgi:hypothetical protein